MNKDRLNLVLGAVVVAVAAVIALMLAAKTWTSGAGLDAQWSLFLVFVFGFILRAVFGGKKDGEDGEN